MASENNSSRTVTSAETTIRVIETLKAEDGMRLTDLASELGMAKSTTHRYLQTLLRNQYLVKEDDHYYLSLRFLEHGDYARTRKEAFQMAKERVTEIANQTNERAIFFVEEHGQAVYVHRETGTGAVQSDEGLGSRDALHIFAGGKAILAEWSDEELQEYAASSSFERRTTNTITDEDAFFDEIETIRERGYAMNNEEAISGLRAIASSICGPDEEVIGSISISGPLHRMKDDRLNDELLELLLGVTNELELNLQYP